MQYAFFWHQLRVINLSNFTTVIYNINYLFKKWSNLLQIIDLDERNQLLKTNIWLNYVWNDANLMWNEVEYKKLVFFMASFFVVSTQFTVKQMYDKSFWWDDWIQTADLWSRRRLLYQLSHYHCPYKKLFVHMQFIKHLDKKPDRTSIMYGTLHCFISYFYL